MVSQPATNGNAHATHEYPPCPSDYAEVIMSDRSSDRVSKSCLHCGLPAVISKVARKHTAYVQLDAPSKVIADRYSESVYTVYLCGACARRELT